MSHQPSQAEVARQTAADYAASAAQTVSETLDPSRKQDEEPKKKPTMKQKLDQAAYESYGQPGQKEETYMEKGTAPLTFFLGWPCSGSSGVAVNSVLAFILFLPFFLGPRGLPWISRLVSVAALENRVAP
jgi:hypothetical protein